MTILGISKERTMAWIIIAVIVLLIVVWMISAYNNLVTLRNRVKNGWAQIDVQLKQRADLVPNLVETVKGYATHESQVFTQVTEARAKAVAVASDKQASTADRIAAENNLTRALFNLQATAEAYPQLQANQNFMDLQRQLQELEQKIAYARQFYNDVVLKFNNAIETFPSNIVAGLFHFEQAEYFQVDDASRQAPQVKF
jgi:LemA protein